ncbi:MAG: hydroxymethylglutaryl-CoA lyase, partial [Alphaproteobacteria bacterium]
MLPARVRMFEVGPRDGLQNEPKAVPLPVKAELIERLANAGLKAIEAGSFVSPKWVPQMADTAELLALLPARPGVVYSVLTPNMTGLQRAIAAGAREVAIFGAATESFSRRNTNCSIEEGLARMGEVAAAAARAGIPVRGYLSCVLGCPYEGAVAAEIVAREAERLFALGCYELSLGDTIGVGTPAKAQTLIDTVAARIPRERLAVHFHDTYGQALANILACLERGVGTIDSSVAGLGGC